jgi:hypothetical protein
MTLPPALRAGLAWAGLAAAIAVPAGFAATSPLLAWRDAVYVAGCLAGVAALALLLLQPLLAGGHLPGLPARRGRAVHAWVGGGLVAAVVLHVAALWVTSPPDVVDALLFRSPTPFSAWGVAAMWAVFAAALLAALRRWQRMAAWRLVHMLLAVAIVAATAAHALLVDGTMEPVSKAALCALALAATAKTMFDLRLPALLRRTFGGL